MLNRVFFNFIVIEYFKIYHKRIDKLSYLFNVRELN